MRPSIYLLTAIFAVQTAAQSSNLLSILVSQAYSIFTSVTQELGNPGTTTSSPSPTSQTAATTQSSQSLTESSSSSASVASTSSSSPTRTSQSTESTSTASSRVSSSHSITSQATLTHTLSSTSNTAGSGTAAAASATSAAAGANKNGNHDRTLAIVLGTVLGALALGLLILLLLLLCRRRRRRRNTIGRRGSLSSASDEALAAHKAPLSRILPLAAVSTPRRSRSSNRKNHIDAPLMTERSNYTVPSPHEFRADSSSPFFPGANQRSSTIDPVPATATDGLTNTNNFRDGTGLNNHPYHENHHTGAALAAGAGGAALGAAAARRHSRSSERRDEVRLSGDPSVHPAYWDEPPPRSPHRNSMDSARRRSGSMPRGSLTDVNGHSHGPLRDGVTTAAAGAAGGAAVGAIADHPGRRNSELGRSLPVNPPAYSQSMNGLGPTPQRLSTGAQPGVPPMPFSQPVGHSNINPLTPTRSHPAAIAGAAAVGAGLASRHHNHTHSRSRSRSHPPLPPALAIPTSNQRRSVPSRSPKRTRFVDSDPNNVPMPLNIGRPNNGILSPPTTSNSSSRNSTTGPISPISADGTPPIISQGLIAPGAGSKLGLVSPRRDYDVSPEPRLPAAAAAAAATSTARPTDPATATLAARNPTLPQPTRQSSGLVNAVQDHFSPTAPGQPAPPGYTYKAYNPSATRNPAPGFPDEVILVTRERERNPRSVTRKPVPHSTYNTGVQNPSMPAPAEAGYGYGSGGGAGPAGGVRTSGGNGNWWRSQEEEAWADAYNPTHVHGDPRRSSGADGGIGRAR